MHTVALDSSERQAESDCPLAKSPRLQVGSGFRGVGRGHAAGVVVAIRVARQGARGASGSDAQGVAYGSG